MLLFALPWDYAIDDTYIHLQFARNLSDGNGFRFDSGEPPVYACSSPLWAMLLSIAYRAGLGGPVTARLLSSLSAGAAAILAWAAARRFGRGAAAFAAPAVMLICMADPWMIRWGASGMEASLAAAAVTAWFLSASSVGAPPLLTGLLAGAAFLVRPELAFLGPLCLSFRRFRMSRRELLKALSPWVLLVSSWTAFAWFHFGRILPTAAASKAFRGTVAAYLAAELPRLLGALAVTFALLATAAAFRRIRRGREESIPGTGALLAPAMLMALLLAGGAPMTTRYLVPVIPLMVTALAGMTLGRPGAPRGRAATLATAVLAVQISFGAALVWPHMAQVARNMEVYRAVSSGLDSLTPPGSLVAVQEIGVFGYESEVRLLDLGGLVTPSAATGYPGLDIDAAASVRFLRESGATHLLDPHGAVERLPGSSTRLGVAFVPLGSWVFPGGTSLSGGQTYTRVLYRLDW